MIVAVTVRDKDTLVTDLSAGVPVNATITAANQQINHYRFAVPEGSQQALFEVYDLDGDADFTLRFNALPEPGAFDFESSNPGAQTERVVVTTSALRRRTLASGSKYRE